MEENLVKNKITYIRFLQLVLFSCTFYDNSSQPVIGTYEIADHTHPATLIFII